jgi:hypothetical protein
MARDGQTLVLSKHLENHGDNPDPSLIATFTLEQYNTLYVAKGWALVNAYGEPVASEEEADPDAQTELVAERERTNREARAKELAAAAKKVQKTATPSAAPATGTGA